MIRPIYHYQSAAEANELAYHHQRAAEANNSAYQHQRAVTFRQLQRPTTQPTTIREAAEANDSAYYH